MAWAGSGGVPGSFLLWAESRDSISSEAGTPRKQNFSFSQQSPWPSLGHLPADFEPIEALVFSAGLLVRRDPELLLQMMEALQDHTTLVGLVNDTHQRRKVEKLLAERKILPRSLRLVEIAHNTVWIRDYGPIFFRFPDMHSGAYDAEYPDPGRRLDDAVPSRLAALFGVSLFALPMVLEGGNLLTNGHGLALTSQAAVIRHSGSTVSEASFRQLLSQHLGIDSLVILEPLAGEPTGHVDMFACFTGPDTVVVGQYDPREDPVNAAILDRNASVLAGCRTSAGPLRVVRIPMPPHRDGIWRTYTNVIFANHCLLVPTYPTMDPAGSRRALELYRRILPGWKVIGVDTSRLITIGGGLRCVSLGIPAPAPSGSLGANLRSGTGLAWLRLFQEIHTDPSGPGGFATAFGGSWDLFQAANR
ncbi:MAG: agmatine deiminase family protein [Thermoguttaceae bacterium]|nr:agmatine deiminase family protein [Thermoguttaceae bacterium]MDW8039195.1 agmatine deiminase family protein [Thermoguttaceae bacterium]